MDVSNQALDKKNALQEVGEIRVLQGLELTARVDPR